jgi:hypothetical protein
MLLLQKIKIWNYFKKQEMMPFCFYFTICCFRIFFFSTVVKGKIDDVKENVLENLRTIQSAKENKRTSTNDYEYIS